ncbi:MAG TPA: RDD family protein [Pilimelia sp.]|nr:RDD family protein [Pilimelia sp.]
MNYATWLPRVGASILDGLLISIPALLTLPYVLVTANPDGTYTSSGWIAYAAGALVSLGLTVYNRFLRQGRTGQSWGKSMLGIRLVGERTGQPIGAGTAFVRELAHFVDTLICYIGYLFPLWDAKRQTVADKVVKSVVVRG